MNVQLAGCQGMLADRRELADRLTEQGLSRRAAEQKAELFGKATAALTACDRGGCVAEPSAFFVPGRIEVLGKHTDYAGGSSMVTAAERGFCLVARPRNDAEIHVTDAASGETVDFELAPELVPRGGHWANYPMTVARRVARNFPQARRGADVAFASDLPPAAGMSSSSAMIVAIFFALHAANELWKHPEYPQSLADPLELAGYLATIENGQSFGSLQGDRGVGTFGGSEDHTAILCARPNQLSQYAYCPVRFERAIPIPAGYTFVVGQSGVVAEKTGAALEKYNRASRLVSGVVELWRRETGRDDPHLKAVLASSSDAAERLKEIVENAPHDDFAPHALLARLEHFITENGQIIPEAGRALEQGDLTTFGRLVDASQRAAEQLLGNQIPQTSRLAAIAREHGAVAASAFGAGFGGSVWAMTETAHAEAFLKVWSDAYRKEFPQNADASSFFATASGPAAFRVS